jgi:hypothetical protein
MHRKSRPSVRVSDPFLHVYHSCTGSECDTVLLPDVWTQHSHNAINKCLRCKRKGGFKKAVGLSRELRELASTTIEMRTITVLFPCELCEVKGKNLRYVRTHARTQAPAPCILPQCHS